MIRVENLTKNYGDVRAINKLNFTIQDGEILGFLGPNGAGKTTTLRIITTYLAPTRGQVYVDDLNVTDHSQEVRAKIGYLPELNPLYTEMTVYDHLSFTAGIRGLAGRRFREALDRVMAACAIRSVMHRYVGELSKGYRQRVGLAQAIIHDPQILLLDEPTSGLDPNQIAEIRELIKELGKAITVVLSTHILQEVQAMADRILILNKGKVVADGTTQELMAAFEGKAHLKMELKNATQASIQALPEKLPTVKLLEHKTADGLDMIQLEYPTGADLREQVFTYAVEAGWVVVEMSRKQAQLEDLFRSLTVGDGTQA